MDHIPLGATRVAPQWEKRYWSNSQDVHVHVRAEGRDNQRYPLLFRDYLRADALASASYAAIKRALAAVAHDDWEAHYRMLPDSHPLAAELSPGSVRRGRSRDGRDGP